MRCALSMSSAWLDLSRDAVRYPEGDGSEQGRCFIHRATCGIPPVPQMGSRRIGKIRCEPSEQVFRPWVSAGVRGCSRSVALARATPARCHDGRWQSGRPMWTAPRRCEANAPTVPAVCTSTRPTSAISPRGETPTASDARCAPRRRPMQSAAVRRPSNSTRRLERVTLGSRRRAPSPNPPSDPGRRAFGGRPGVADPRVRRRAPRPRVHDRRRRDRGPSARRQAGTHQGGGARHRHDGARHARRPAHGGHRDERGRRAPRRHRPPRRPPLQHDDRRLRPLPQGTRSSDGQARCEPPRRPGGVHLGTNRHNITSYVVFFVFTSMLPS